MEGGTYVARLGGQEAGKGGAGIAVNNSGGDVGRPVGVIRGDSGSRGEGVRHATSIGEGEVVLIGCRQRGVNDVIAAISKGGIFLTSSRVQGLLGEGESTCCAGNIEGCSGIVSGADVVEADIVGANRGCGWNRKAELGGSGGTRGVVHAPVGQGSRSGGGAGDLDAIDVDLGALRTDCKTGAIDYIGFTGIGVVIGIGTRCNAGDCGISEGCVSGGDGQGDGLINRRQGEGEGGGCFFSKAEEDANCKVKVHVA